MADYISANRLSPLGGLTPIEDMERGLTYVSYAKNVSGTHFVYFAVLTKGMDAFWICNFACLYDQEDELKEKFLTWAETIIVL